MLGDKAKLAWSSQLRGFAGRCHLLTVTPLQAPALPTPPADWERQGAEPQQVWEVGWMQRMLVGEQGELVLGEVRAGEVPQPSTVQREGALQRMTCAPGLLFSFPSESPRIHPW